MKKRFTIPNLRKGILISGIVIGILFLVALITTIMLYYTEERDEAFPSVVSVNEMQKAPERRSVIESTILPAANLYMNFGRKMDPNTIFFKNDPKFPDHGFLTCVDTDRMYLIQCPSKGWTGSAHEEIYWNDDEGTVPDDVVRLYIFNNCDPIKRLTAVGTNVPDVLQVGIDIPPHERVSIDLKIGFDASLFSQIKCGKNAGHHSCETCSCLTDNDEHRCIEKPLACSFVDVKVTSGRTVTYRIDNTRSFTTSYILSPGDKKMKENQENQEKQGNHGTCQASGGDIFFTTQQVLKQCPEELAFKDPDGVVQTCASLCTSCEIDNIVKGCQCIVDHDCQDCTIYIDASISDYDVTPPLKCINNRCRSKLTRPDGRSCDTIVKTPQGDFTYIDVFCCNGISKDICEHLNGGPTN